MSMPAYPADEVGVNGFQTSIGFTPSTWPVNAKLTMCHVPWDADYRDVVYFSSSSARDAYFTGMASTSKHVMANATYCRPNEPVKVNLPYSSAYTYNYLIVENPALPVPGEVTPPKLYYFITGVSMIAPNTTGLYLQLDVWMTYQLNVTLARAFVERGHVARHAYATSTDGNTQYRRRRYLTAPEGLDVGNAYMIANETEYDMVGAIGWYAIVVSAADIRLAASETMQTKFGTVNNPLLPVARGFKSEGIISACDVYAIPLDSTQWTQFVSALSAYPWIANQILSVTAMPGKVLDPWQPVTTDYLPGNVAPIIPKSLLNIVDNDTITISSLQYFITQRANADWKGHEKAGLWPYSYISLDNQCSEPVLCKPELFPADTVNIGYFATVMPPFQRIAVMPEDYTAQEHVTLSQTNQYTMDGTTAYQAPSMGDRFASSLLWQDFPQLSILNDGYINYLATNARSLAFSRNNQGWQLDKSLAGIQTSYDNAARSLSAAAQNQQLAYRTQRDISRYSMGNLVANQLRETYNALSGEAHTSFNRIFGGADVSAIINTSVNAQTGATANEVGNLQFQTTQQAQQGNIDANYQLQQWAARGDYEQAIASIDATVQDAQLTPPNQAGLLGGGWSAVLASKGLFCWWLRAYTVPYGAQKRLISFWDRFGYAVNEYVQIGRKFCVMSKFTYWKCQDTMLTTSTYLDEGAKAIIRGIFEKGVTVWCDADAIGTNPANTVLTGVSETALY